MECIWLHSAGGRGQGCLLYRNCFSESVADTCLVMGGGVGRESALDGVNTYFVSTSCRVYG